MTAEQKSDPWLPQEIINKTLMCYLWPIQCFWLFSLFPDYIMSNMMKHYSDEEVKQMWPFVWHHDKHLSLLSEKQSLEILPVVYVSSTLIHTIFAEKVVKHLKSLFYNH